MTKTTAFAAYVVANMAVLPLIAHMLPRLTPAGLYFAVTVEPVSGGPVYASRMLSLPLNGVPMFTVQPMPDDRGMVEVPKAGPDLTILNR